MILTNLCKRTVTFGMNCKECEKTHQWWKENVIKIPKLNRPEGDKSEFWQSKIEAPRGNPSPDAQSRGLSWTPFPSTTWHPTFILYSGWLSSTNRPYVTEESSCSDFYQVPSTLGIENPRGMEKPNFLTRSEQSQNRRLVWLGPSSPIIVLCSQGLWELLILRAGQNILVPGFCLTRSTMWTLDCPAWQGLQIPVVWLDGCRDGWVNEWMMIASLEWEDERTITSFMHLLWQSCSKA